MDWKTANSWAKNLTQAGLSGWRLPTLAELQSLKNRGKVTPTEWLSNKNIQTDGYSGYWCAGSSNYVGWDVVKSSGIINDSYNQTYKMGYAWPVRSSQFKLKAK